MTDGLAAWFRDLGDAGRRRLYAELSEPERAELDFVWDIWARPEQIAPPTGWRIWLICAGRGFGKTRAGAEWVRHIAVHRPDARIALVGASLAEVRSVMGVGQTNQPNRLWTATESRILLTPEMLGPFPGQAIWVQQIGRNAKSYPLFLMTAPQP